MTYLLISGNYSSIKKKTYFKYFKYFSNLVFGIYLFIIVFNVSKTSMLKLFLVFFYLLFYIMIYIKK